MKKSVFVPALLVALLAPAHIYAEETLENPSFRELDELMTEMALEENIPPEIVKAVAYQESDLLQFVDGEPNIASDGGIGIMQVTDDRFDQERLQEDIAYNIESGITLLLEKKSWEGDQLPEINGAEWYDLESWYFPVMAYNGLVHANSPIRRADESHNSDAYQERVFEHLSGMNTNLELASLYDHLSLENLDYRDNNRLAFTTDTVDIPYESLTKSRYVFEEGQTMIVDQTANFREDATPSSERIRQLPRGTVVTLESNYLFDRTANINEDDLNYSRMAPWFEVTDSSGNNGYLAGGTISPLTPTLISLDEQPGDQPNLTDIDNHWAQNNILNLVEAGVISGYSDNTFRPNDQISRQEFAHLIRQLLDGIPEHIDTSWVFEDPEPAEWAKPSIMVNYHTGIIGGFPNHEFRAEESVTRAEIATIMERLMTLTDHTLPKGEPVRFKDELPEWAESSIMNMTAYGLVNGYDDETFRPRSSATRAEVASILYRFLQ